MYSIYSLNIFMFLFVTSLSIIIMGVPKSLLIHPFCVCFYGPISLLVNASIFLLCIYLLFLEMVLGIFGWSTEFWFLPLKIIAVFAGKQLNYLEISLLCFQGL